MRNPKAVKLPSGKWNCKVMVNGVRKSFTAFTKAQAEYQAMQWKLDHQTKAPSVGTLGEAMERYIAEREPVLSPSTIRRYRKVVEHNFIRLQRRAIITIDERECQQEINSMVSHYSAKTIKNVWAFVSAVLKECGKNITVNLPQVISEPHPFLEPEQIPAFLKELEGEELEIPILLALHGLRRSEIVDLEWKDVDLKKGRLHVTGAAVIDSNGTLVHKRETKNQSSRREVPILIPRLRELLDHSLRESKYVVTCNPNSIYNAANRICRRLGYPEVGVHGLRHTFASLCYSKGVSEAATMKLGGWSDFGTMRKIYTHLAQADLKEAETNLSSFFSDCP